MCVIQCCEWVCGFPVLCWPGSSFPFWLALEPMRDHPHHMGLKILPLSANRPWFSVHGAPRGRRFCCDSPDHAAFTSSHNRDIRVPTVETFFAPPGHLLANRVHFRGIVDSTQGIFLLLLFLLLLPPLLEKRTILAKELEQRNWRPPHFSHYCNGDRPLSAKRSSLLPVHLWQKL